METLLWIGFSQSLFSATLFLLVKKEQSLSNKILSAWLFIFAFEFLSTAIDHTLGFTHLTNPFLIFNPLLYFYSRSLIKAGMKLRWRQLWHVAPYLFFKIGAYLDSTQISFSDFYNISINTWFNFTFGVISVGSFFGYSILSLIMVHRYRMNLKNEFSTLSSKITLGWLIFVIIVYLSFMVTAYLLGLIDLLFREETFVTIITYTFSLGLIYIFSFYGLLQQQIYTLVAEEQTEKYKNPRLSPQTINEEVAKLKKYFQEEEPFLDSELSVYTVSEKLALSRHSLTEVLNTGTGRNFYQFVNDYRIERVKQKLVDPGFRKYSIDAIGFECGFKSKSTFYDVFKKYTGLTPSQFRASQDIK